jgi:hypothetical protein
LPGEFKVSTYRRGLRLKIFRRPDALVYGLQAIAMEVAVLPSTECLPCSVIIPPVGCRSRVADRVA